MRTNILKKTLTMMLAFAMVFTMMPLLDIGAQEAYAAPESGGTVTVDTTNDAKTSAKTAFNLTDSDVTSSGDTITIKLKENIVLSDPVKFVRGTAGKKVVLDLNGCSITGRAGSSGTDYDAAEGGNAIEIAADDFDVEIKGAGSVVGGKGGVYESDDHFKTGRKGGCAVQFVNNNYSPAQLNYGLTITGGAVLRGGDGADVSGDQWLYNIQHYSGRRSSVGSMPSFEAGMGGAGIGQANAGILFVESAIAFARIDVANGTVTGGKGGNVNMQSITPTIYSLMNSDAAKAAMVNSSTGASYENGEYYNDKVASLSDLYVGKGGDGIKIGCGRKHIRVGQGSTVSGSSCGNIDFGSNKAYTQLNAKCSYGEFPRDSNFNAGDAGDGIAVWVSDLGIRNDEPGYSENAWTEKTKESNDMGIYIEGTVTGGNAPDTDALNQGAFDGGAGIFLQGDAGRFGLSGNDSKWGIVDVAAGGAVCGGNGGSAASGHAGRGGCGILDNYSIDAEGHTNGSQGTNYYIVNGSVKGGKGGDSFAVSSGNGSGGDGMNFTYNYRAGLCVAGNGTVKGGDAGSTVGRDASASDHQAEAIHLYTKNNSDYNNTITVSKINDGATAVVENKSEIVVKASMTAFNDYPNTNTKLSYEITATGYSGPVYVNWFATLYLQTNTPQTLKIEPSGNSNNGFFLHSNGDYRYLSYPGVPDTKYNYGIATTNRMYEDALKFKNSKIEIYCKVLLADGRWGKSNVMTVSTNDRNESSGWNGSSSGGGGDEQTDEQAANAVMNMIRTLPWPTAIKVSDEADVVAARNAYNALTPAQKALVEPSLLAKLEACEARIAELKEQSGGGDSGGDQGGGDQGGGQGGGGNVAPGGNAGQPVPAEIQDLPAVRISEPKAGKKKVTVKWKKPKKKVLKQIQGIEIRVVGPEVDKTTTAGKKKTSKKIGGLKSKKKYTVQIRAYKNAGGVKHVSAWKSKSVKVK